MAFSMIESQIHIDATTGVRSSVQVPGSVAPSVSTDFFAS